MTSSEDRTAQQRPAAQHSRQQRPADGGQPETAAQQHSAQHSSIAERPAERVRTASLLLCLRSDLAAVLLCAEPSSEAENTAASPSARISEVPPRPATRHRHEGLRAPPPPGGHRAIRTWTRPNKLSRKFDSSIPATEHGSSTADTGLRKCNQINRKSHSTTSETLGLQLEGRRRHARRSPDQVSVENYE